MTNKETQTELEIAKTFIIGLKSKDKLVREQFRHECVMHKQFSQRFLEFLREVNLMKVVNSNSVCLNDVEDKITDLKSTIKEYETNGI